VEHPVPSTPARRRRAIAVVLIGLVGALGLSACSDTVGYTEPTGDKIQGEKLFVSNCGSCHTLRDAGTTGAIGPDLDYAFVQSRIDGLGEDTILQVVRAQIAYPVTTPSTGAPGMPANIVEGQDADDVATYVASVAGLDASGKPMDYFDETTKKKFVPHVIEPAVGVDRILLAVLCAGAVVLFGDDGMTIGAGTVLAANAVLTCSTGPGEIWAGAPARKIADRARRPAPHPP